MEPPIYRIAHRPAELFEGPDALAAWQGAAAVSLNHFHPAGSSHRPVVQVRMVHHDTALRIRFDVRDRYVIARQTQPQQNVCLDSCVELFLRPQAEGGYFNFEFNCAGVMLAYYIEDWRKTPAGFQKFTPLTSAEMAAIQVKTSLHGPIATEIPGPIDWWLEALIPLSPLEHYAGPLLPLRGQKMTGNFYKCADHSSHPHWASWQPIGELLNFHQPDRFGAIAFE